MADRDPRIPSEAEASGHDVLGDEFTAEDGTISEQTAVVEGEELPAERATGLRRWRKPLLLLIPLIAIVGGLFYYLSGGRYQETEDAYVQSGLLAVSPRIDGQVIAVEVHSNQPVHTGDVLFRIDPAPYQTAVAEAQAQLATAISAVRGLRANYAQGQSELAAARQKVLFADREARRQGELVREGISSQAQYDQALLAARTARQAVETSIQQNAAVAASLSGALNASPTAQPDVRRAQAALDRAKLNLSYTIVRAPQDGVLAKVDQLQVGSHVTAGKPVFSLSSTRMWVEANFKENQLRYMRLGQPASITIDAFPDAKLTGHVASFSPGTGNRFSVLPAENATGNWVKVVQRLPVELSIDRLPAGVPIQAGLSANVSVDTGHKRHLFGS